MRSLERHRDVGAYVLGVLDEAEAFRFEDHLMECPPCASQVTGFGPTARQLMLYRRAPPRLVHPMAQPGPRLLDRLLGELGHRHRARRRRLLYGLAASVVLAVAGPAVVTRAGPEEPAARVTAATDPRTGVWAEVTAADGDAGSRLRLRVKDGTGPHACRLVVVGRDGSEEVAGGWAVPGHATATTTTVGASAFHPDQITRYEVRTEGGRPLVTLKAP